MSNASRRRSLPRLAALLVGLATFTPSPELARAGNEPALRLDWSAPDGCPSAADVQARLDALTAPEALSWQRFEAVRGRIFAAAPGWQLELDFSSGGESRRRTLRAVECRDLAGAAALAILLALSTPQSAAAEVAEAEIASPTPVGPPPPTPGEDAVVKTGVPGSRGAVPTERVAFDLGAEVLFDPTTLGPAAFGPAALLRARRANFGAALYGLIFPAARNEVGSGQSVDIGLWAAGLRGCWLPLPALASCAGVEAGRMTGQGVGLRAGATESDLWLAPGLSLELLAPRFKGFVLRTSVAALAPLVRGRFRVDESEVVHQVPFVALRLGVGLELAFR